MSDKARERLAKLEEEHPSNSESANSNGIDDSEARSFPVSTDIDAGNINQKTSDTTNPNSDGMEPIHSSDDQGLKHNEVVPEKPEDIASSESSPLPPIAEEPTPPANYSAPVSVTDPVTDNYGLAPDGPDAVHPKEPEDEAETVTKNEDEPDYGSIEKILAGSDEGSARKDDIPLSPSGGYAWLEGVRFWSNQDYTRIVVELDREVPYEPPRMLKADGTLGTPPRLYIDFKGTLISTKMADPDTPEPGCFTLPIGDGLLKKARAGQYQPDVARVVLDIERIEHFNAFPLPGDKFRYVIDVYGSREAMPGVAKNSRKKPREPGEKSPVLGEWPEDREKGRSWWRPGSGKNETRYIVVLDPGHGGKDPGAMGPSGSKEKDIALKIAHLAKDEIESGRSDIKVVLTRSDDRFIPLVERTAMANTMDADLFVSIHINAAKNKAAQGIETYYLDNTTDRAALKLAAKENFVEEKELVDSRDTTNLILADLITSSKVEDSVPLAESLQKSLVASQRERWPGVVDKGVKKAPFWVLTGATMPCALVEAGFISNKEEEKRLLSESYQRQAAKGIARGILDYIDGYHQVSLNQ